MDKIRTNLKAKTLLISGFLLCLSIVLLIFLFPKEKLGIPPKVYKEKLKAKTISDSTQNIQPEAAFKKVNDTTVVFFFKDLSNEYNYKIIDRFYSNESHRYFDTIIRIIKIFTKNDSLVQKIYPKLSMSPWYLNFVRKYRLRVSRSFITGKNAYYEDVDNYCGEIVVADLNFDGLEDFATPVDSGADNGPHYAFYIQQKNNKFKFNKYLSEEVIWFPEKFNDSLKTFTTITPCGIYGIAYQHFRYDTSTVQWRATKGYLIDVRTGKVMK